MQCQYCRKYETIISAGVQDTDVNLELQNRTCFRTGLQDSVLIEARPVIKLVNFTQWFEDIRSKLQYNWLDISILL